LPKRIHSDQGANFESKIIKAEWLLVLSCRIQISGVLVLF
jgi:hypothetical protein